MELQTKLKFHPLDIQAWAVGFEPTPPSLSLPWIYQSQPGGLGIRSKAENNRVSTQPTLFRISAGGGAGEGAGAGIDFERAEGERMRGIEIVRFFKFKRGDGTEMEPENTPSDSPRQCPMLGRVQKCASKTSPSSRLMKTSSCPHSPRLLHPLVEGGRAALDLKYPHVDVV